jgi:hypothetical protein
MSRHRTVLLVSVAATLLSGASVSQAAVTLDAVADFTLFSPTGTWSYGSGATGTSFTPFSVRGDPCAAAGLQCWTSTNPDLTPIVAKNTTGSFFQSGTMLYDPAALFLHPGSGSDSDSIVRFTAPATATYQVKGFFEILDTAPTGVKVIFGGGSDPLQTVMLTGPAATAPDMPGGMVTFDQTVSLTAGQDFFFGVDNNGDFTGDAVGLAATFTAADLKNTPVIPEPGTWASMLLGFGALGAVLRARRRAVTA